MSTDDTDDTDGTDMSDLLEDFREELAEMREENRKLREENKKLRDGGGTIDADKPGPPSNDEIVEQWIATRNYAESTQRPYRLVIKYFREFTDDKPLCDVTKADAISFANNYGGDDPPAANTMSTYLSRVVTLFDYMVEQPWGPEKNIVKPARDEFRDQHKAEIRRAGKHGGTVLDVTEYVEVLKRNRAPRQFLMLLLPAKTGLRRKELVRLKVEDIDLEEKKLYNRSPKGVGEKRLPKSDADQKLLDDETVRAVEAWLDTERPGPDQEWLFPSAQGGAITKMTLSRHWYKARERAAKTISDDDLEEKVESFAPHDARRCFTSWLNWNGCPREIIKALRGDADGDLVDLYTHYSEETIREEYEEAMPTIGLT